MRGKMKHTNLYLGFISGIIIGIVVGVNGHYFLPKYAKFLLVASSTEKSQTSLIDENTNHAAIEQERALRQASAQRVANKIYFCPSVDTIYKNIKKSGNWQDQGLTWSFDHRVWEPTKRLRFERVLIKKVSNELSCYYVWPDPSHVKTKRWLTVTLNVDYDQVVKREGLHWNKNTGLNKLLKEKAHRSYISCNATAIRSCAFSVHSLIK